MHSALQAENLWSQLSPELWDLILTCVKTSFDDHFDIFENDYDQNKQISLHNVRLVCKKLNLSFQNQPALFQDIVLGASWSSCKLPSLMLWLQAHGSLVRRLAACCESPPLDAVLAGLCQHHPGLDYIALQQVSSTSLPLLSMFTNLKQCHLQPTTEEGMSLKALSYLLKLVQLSLFDGDFVDLDVLSHLTGLHVSGCSTECKSSARWTGSLLWLYVNDSTIDFDAAGIAACHRLRSLCCHAGCIPAFNDTDSLQCDEPVFHVPSSLSQLTALTELTLSSWCSGHVSCDWVSRLLSLESLQIKSSAPMMVLPACFSMLTSLKSLALGALLDGKMRVEFDWAGLASLQFFECDGDVVFSTDLRILATLSHLREVSFLTLSQCQPVTTQQLMILAHKVGRERPEVTIYTRC